MKILSFVAVFVVLMLPIFDASDENDEKLLSRQKKSLIYPQYTVLQVISASFLKDLLLNFVVF